MIKNCIIYKYSKEFENQWQVDKRRIDQSKLMDCLEKAEGSTKPKIKALTEIAQGEELSLLEETKEHYIVSTSCEFKVPKLLAAGGSPFVPVSFKIWLRKKSSLVVTFDAGRKLSGVGNALLSYATTENPSSIEHLKLDKNDFLEFKNWLLSSGHTSQIRRINMRNIEYLGWKFKQVVLSADQLEDSRLFNDLLNPTLIISDMSFITPPLKASGRPLSCRINHWGGITIYTPNLLDSEISEFIGVFEKLAQK
jgi:hypothetical protein